MLLRNIMKRIKLGNYYILDEACDASLKEYQPIKVRPVTKLGRGNYIVMPIEPVVFPVTEDGWAVKPFRVHKKYLSPTTHDERIVIRCPLNMPKFSINDEIALSNIYDKLINGGNISNHDIMRLKAIIHKIRYVTTFNEVNL